MEVNSKYLQYSGDSSVSYIDNKSDEGQVSAQAEVQELLLVLLGDERVPDKLLEGIVVDVGTGGLLVNQILDLVFQKQIFNVFGQTKLKKIQNWSKKYSPHDRWLSVTNMKCVVGLKRATASSDQGK